jgi:hypothetical protein
MRDDEASSTRLSLKPPCNRKPATALTIMPPKPLLAGKKTYVAAALAVLTALGGWLTGDLSPADALQTAITAIIGATLRHGMKTETGG